jgi:hypothetical protein
MHNKDYNPQVWKYQPLQAEWTNTCRSCWTALHMACKTCYSNELWWLHRSQLLLSHNGLVSITPSLPASTCLCSRPRRAFVYEGQPISLTCFSYRCPRSADTARTETRPATANLPAVLLPLRLHLPVPLLPPMPLPILLLPPVPLPVPLQNLWAAPPPIPCLCMSMLALWRYIPIGIK